jgi:hypothetical protein
MKFFFHHSFLTALSGSSGLLLSHHLNRFLSRKPELAKRINSSLEMKGGQILSSLIFGAFVLWAYVLPNAYYYPWNIGVVGDTYHLLHWAMRDDGGYWLPHHFYYPWFAGKFIRFCSATGLLSKNDPLFLEKSVAVSIVPNRIAIILAFLCLAWALRISGFTRFDSILGTFFIAATAGCWLWGHQSNALGFALAIQMFASTAILAWCRRFRRFDLLLMGLFLGAGLYVHGALIYFLAGGYFSVLFILLKNNELKPAEKKIQFLFFNLIIFLLGGVFYWLAGRHFKAFEPRALFRAMADTPISGDFKLQLNRLPILIKDNLVSTLMNLFSYWDPKTSFDLSLNAIQILLMSSFVFILALNIKAVIRRLLKNESIFFALISVVTFGGFLLRGAAMHYYVVATVPNAILLFLLFFKAEPNGPQLLQRRILWCFLMATMILYSGFSSWNVLGGSRLSEDEYYRVSRTIADTLKPGEKAIYVRPFEFDYRENHIRNYYHHELGQIDWRTGEWQQPIPPEAVVSLRSALREGIKVFLADGVVETLRPSAHTAITQHLAQDINSLDAI